MKTVGYFGNYNPNHPRNIIFINCLRLAGYQVLEINHREGRFKKYFKLIRDLWANQGKIDYLIVGFPGQSATILANLFFRKPIIFNALLSFYDAMIIDRQVYSKFSPPAAYYWLMDFLAVRSANKVILDCQAYIDFFVKKFKVSRDKFVRIFLGADETKFKSMDIEKNKSEIHYYSSFLPSHGPEIIIKAAKLLEKEGIKFIFSGQGQGYEGSRRMVQRLGVKNIKFIGRFGQAEQLNRFINSSFVCLGLFGTNPKSKRAIASKVFEALCCGRPVITGRSPANQELLRDGESVLFVDPASPEDLAEKIILLKNNPALREKIAQNGQRVYQKKASFSIIAQELKNILDKV